LGPQDAVAILLVRAPESQYSRAQESDVTTCIERALRGKYPKVRLVAADEVRRSAFAGTEPEAIRSDSGFWDEFLAQTETRPRLAPLGLSFLIPVTVVEEQSPARGAVRSTRGTMLVGVVREWDVWSRMKADILDLAQARRAGTVESTGHGQSYYWGRHRLRAPAHYSPAVGQLRPTRGAGLPGAGQWGARIFHRRGAAVPSAQARQGGA
jgi:hypothetical protein